MKATNQRQEHTTSYYAATVNEHTDYPCLEGARSYRSAERRSNAATLIASVMAPVIAI